MKLKTVVTGVCREIKSANGKTHHFSEVWVQLPGMPFPVQVDHYGVLSLPKGSYEVPYSFVVRDNRISVQLHFGQAEQSKPATA